MKKFYLITTEHLEKMLWFRCDEDFRMGMNSVAILAALHPNVTVLGFVLMSNHVHLVVMSDMEEVISFVNQLKGRYSRYVQFKYGVKELLRRNRVHLKEVSVSDGEALERVLAYVHMNPVSANLCSHPCQYPWGTGNVFFNPVLPASTCIGDLSKRARIRVLRSECIEIPPDWMLSSDGYILPQSYVDVAIVEDFFRSPKRMNYFYNTSSKARKRIDLSEKSLPSFSDQLIRVAVPELCRTLFQRRSFDELTSSEQTEMLRQIRFRFSADVGQLARVCGLTYADAANMLDSE